MANPLQQLHDLGQSVWLDSIRRSYLAPGGYLSRLVDDEGVEGAGELGREEDRAHHRGAALGAVGAQGFTGTAPVTGASTVHAWAVGVLDDLAFAVVTEDNGGSTELAVQVAERFLREVAALRR